MSYADDEGYDGYDFLHERESVGLTEIIERLTTLERVVSSNAETECGQREWVGLTEDEKAYSNTDYAGKRAEAWQGGVDWAEAKLKEKNT